MTSERYRLGALLGEGAVGTVWRAWDEVLQRDVALKLLKPAYAGDERTVARFYREARAAARIAHPNAVLVHDIVAEPERHAIVMEYVAGESLETVLRAEGSVGEARAVELTRRGRVRRSPRTRTRSPRSRPRRRTRRRRCSSR
ncbi:MAG TPA: protein kinase [Candidatus Elarobacter sp.]|nr:protein kinase [Candidatus Elarobacter sp.]